MARKIWLCLIVLLLMMDLPQVHAADWRREDEALRNHIEELCTEYDVPALLIYAVIERESNWNADAVNADGNCFGLMQIHEVNFGWLEKHLGLDHPKDPYQNVAAGIYMLSQYIDTYLDYHMALMCYNCGEAGARRLWEQGQFTSEYSLWIVEKMHDLEWEQLSAARALCAEKGTA